MHARRSTRRPRHRLDVKRPVWIAGCLLNLALTPVLLAQPTVQLEVSSDKPYVNETITVTVHVTNAGKVQRPEFPALPNCSVVREGSRFAFHSDTDSTGRAVMVRRQSYEFYLKVSKAGDLTIPAISVVADGKTLETAPHRLVVRDVPRSPPPKPDQRDDSGDDTGDLLSAEITCRPGQLYVGQRVKFTLTIWIKAAQYGGQPLSKQNMLKFLTGSIAPFDPDTQRTREVDRESTDHSSDTYYGVEFTAEITLDQPGPLTFDGVTIGANYPTRFRVDRVWRELEVVDQKPMRVRPRIAAPDVQPLPTEGRPPNFSGAVGEYQLSAFAVPTNVRVGDPIQLVIDISGDPIETIPGPDLTAVPTLVDAFRVPRETLAGTVRGNSKRFTQTIRAKRADVKEIPPIEFAYFDPHAGQYAVARSEPIPILVSVVEQLDAADLSDIATPPSAPQNAGLQARDGLRGNKTGEAELLAVIEPVTTTQVALTTVIPPAVFACFWGLTALMRSGRDQAVQRRRAALRNAERRIQVALAGRLPPGEFHGEIQAALAGYLADRLNQPPARFVGHAAVTFLEQRGVDRELVRRCADLLERCERAAYAGGSDGDTSLADMARQCARQLERERL